MSVFVPAERRTEHPEKASGEARCVPRATAGTTGTGFVASDRFRTLTRPVTTKIKEIIRKANRYTKEK